jgi:hypothetical protein
MTPEEALGAIAGEMNGVPETAARTQRHMLLVSETNTLVRAAADALITLDLTPLSFAALKATCEPRA